MLNVHGSPHPCKLSNISHFPDFGYSLMSFSQMVSKGLQVSFESDKCIDTAGPTVVATASQVGDLYRLDVMNETFSAHLVALPTLHERTAYFNVQGIASMIHNNVVSGINGRQSDVVRAMNPKSDNHSLICPACVFGKATRSAIPKQRSSSRAQNCLDLVIVKSRSEKFAANIRYPLSRRRWLLGVPLGALTISTGIMTSSMYKYHT